jgi:protein associated with RNAse G/E
MRKRRRNVMAKIAFSKLGLKVNTQTVTIIVNEQPIEIKQYLSMSEKADMIARIINCSIDDNGFYNPLKVQTFLTLETVYTYTNLTFTDKMKENEMKLYDIFVSSGLYDLIIESIPEQEWKMLNESIYTMINNVYNYKNSALGIIENVVSDYGNMELDANALTDTLLNPESLSTLKELLPLAQ